MEIDILWFLGFLGAEAVGAYAIFRKKRHAFRLAVDAVDDALYDDKITEVEYRDIWERFRELFRK